MLSITNQLSALSMISKHLHGIVMPNITLKFLSLGMKWKYVIWPWTWKLSSCRAQHYTKVLNLGHGEKAISLTFHTHIYTIVFHVKHDDKISCLIIDTHESYYIKSLMVNLKSFHVSSPFQHNSYDIFFFRESLTKWCWHNYRGGEWIIFWAGG